MTGVAVAESVVEEAALAWFQELGYAVLHGLAIAPGESAAERDDYIEVVLPQRLRGALTRLSRSIPSDALDDAFRRITRPEFPSLAQNNYAFHRLLVNGLPLEYLGP
jgi:type I restriction enzyme, R subunit